MILSQTRIRNCKQQLLIGIVLACSSLCSSCTSLFESHPYAGQIDGKKHLTAKNVALIEKSLKGKTTFRFAFISDTQRDYDATIDVVNTINARGDIDFVVHGGDMSDFGLTSEFEWMRDILERLKMPFISVIGNHDCIGNGEHIYYQMFGEFNYAFTAGNTRFICLNTNSLEYDYSDPVPDFNFLQSESDYIAGLPQDEAIERTIFVMHSHPYDEQFNNNVAVPFNYYVTKFPGMGNEAPSYIDNPTKPQGAKKYGFCLNGHNHSTSISDIFNNGIIYYQVANITKRHYMVFTITEEGYDYEDATF